MNHSAEQPKPVKLKLFDKPFACTVCACDTFHQKRWEFKAPGSSFFKSAERALALVCTKCAYIHWFKPEMGEYKVGET